MGVMTRIKRMMGGDQSEAETEAAEPSHVCQSCGEEYFADASYDIDTCRSCGGVRVERA